MPSLPPSRTWGRTFQQYYPVLTSADTRPFLARCVDAVWLQARLSFAALAIAMVLLSWPIGIGASSTGEVEPYSFMVFIGVYSVISFPIQFASYHYALGALTCASDYALMIVVGELGVQGFFLVYIHYSSVGSLTLVRTVGPLAFTLTILARYFARSLCPPRPLPAAIIEAALSAPVLAGTGASVGLMNAALDSPLLSPAAAGRPAKKVAFLDTDTMSEHSLATHTDGAASPLETTAQHGRDHNGADDDTVTQFARLVSIEDHSFRENSATAAAAPNDDADVHGGSALSSLVSLANGQSLRFEGESSSFTAKATTKDELATALQHAWHTRMEGGKRHAAALERLEIVYCAMRLGVPMDVWYLRPAVCNVLSRYVIVTLSGGVMYLIFVWVQFCSEQLFAGANAPMGVGDAAYKYVLFASVLEAMGTVAKRISRVSDTLKTVGSLRLPLAAAWELAGRQSFHARHAAHTEDGSIIAAATAATVAATLTNESVDGEPTVAQYLAAEATVREASLRLHRDAPAVSVEVLVEITLAHFYAVFFRALFQSLDSWAQFALMSSLHLMTLAVLYPLRMTRWYFRLTDRLQQSVKGRGVLGLLYDPSNGAQWNSRIAVDFMLRFVAANTAALAFMAVTTFLRFSYNRGRYTYFGSDLSDADFGRSMIFIALSVAVEIIGAVLMAVSTRGLVKGGITAPLIALLRRHTGYQLFIIAAGAHIITDVFLAHVKLGRSITTGSV
jgi:hypothetical protein